MSPQNIISDISGCYDRALLEGDLFFFPSTVHKHKESNIEVRLPFFPATGCTSDLPAFTALYINVDTTRALSVWLLRETSLSLDTLIR